MKSACGPQINSWRHELLLPRSQLPCSQTGSAAAAVPPSLLASSGTRVLEGGWNESGPRTVGSANSKRAVQGWSGIGGCRVPQAVQCPTDHRCHQLGSFRSSNSPGRRVGHLPLRCFYSILSSNLFAFKVIRQMLFLSPALFTACCV